jgi:hypothetical protein
VTPITHSNTPIGALASGAASSVSFAVVGRAYFDGNGGISAGSSATAPAWQVGKYTVNTDCTISATITDAFVEPFSPFLPSIQASATFEGVVVQSGDEIVLAQTGGASGTTLTFKKMKQTGGCAEDVLSGTFGLAATGLSSSLVAETNTMAVTPFNLAGRFVGDGGGKFVVDSLADQSVLKSRLFTGTYSVNGDCTGAGTLVDNNGKSRKIGFVIVDAEGGTNGASGMMFAFTDSTTIGYGLAKQQ